MPGLLANRAPARAPRPRRRATRDRRAGRAVRRARAGGARSPSSRRSSRPSSTASGPGRSLGPGRPRRREGGGGAQRIETPYLQLVMQRLWEVECAEGSRELRLRDARAARRRRTDRRGAPGARAQPLTPRQQEVAARMFNHLVTPSGTKIAHGTATWRATPRLAGRGRPGARRARARADPAAGRRAARPPRTRSSTTSSPAPCSRGADGSRRRGRCEQARRRHRRLVLLACASVAAVAVLAAVAVFALAQRGDARRAAVRAHARELDARALAALSTDPQAGLAHALRAAQLAPDVQAERVLRTLLLAARLRAVLPAGDRVTSATFSDGRTPHPDGVGRRERTDLRRSDTPPTAHARRRFAARRRCVQRPRRASS